MTGTKLLGRLERLEQNQPSQSYSGAMRFIWEGPQDNAGLAEAEAQAGAENKLLIVRKIIARAENALLIDVGEDFLC